MTKMLNSIKADLLSTRMLPAVVLIGVVLLGGIAYAVIGGSTTSNPVVPTPHQPVASVPGPVVSQAQPTSSNEAVAETTNGKPSHHGSGSKDPFKPLPESAAEKKAKAADAKKTPASGSSASSSTSTSTSSSSTSTNPTTVQTGPPAKAKPKPKSPVYHVTALFGQAPTPAQNTPLGVFKDLARLQPLPSAQHPLVAFIGVSTTGKTAVFTLLSEAILRGEGVCLPSTSQCEAIGLTVGKSEELEYIEPDGQPVIYQLRIQGIVKSEKASTTARKANSIVSAAGRRLVASGQLQAAVDLRFSAIKGVLVLFNGHHAHGAKAAAHQHSH